MNNQGNKSYQDYVLVYPYAFDADEHVLLVRKQSPDWQKGKLNLVGGKVEEGEDPKIAAIRECREETSISLDEYSVEKLGTIQGPWGRVHVFNGLADSGRIDDPAPEDPNNPETVAWHYICDVLGKPDLIPNLNFIIPLCHLAVPGWTILDSVNPYEFGVRIEPLSKEGE